MIRATWNGVVLAESDHAVPRRSRDRTEVVEGNHYFPPESINQEYFRPSDTHTTCPWKGEASYHTIVVNGKENKDAAWYYPHAKEKAKQIEGYIAFWRGVQVG